MSFVRNFKNSFLKGSTKSAMSKSIFTFATIVSNEYGHLPHFMMYLNVNLGYISSDSHNGRISLVNKFWCCLLEKGQGK